jgi:carboxyl-terminal processing protease
MKRALIFLQFFIALPLFSTIECNAEELPNNFSSQYQSSDLGLIDRCEGLITEAYDIIVNNYYPSMSPYSLLLGAVKGLDSRVKPINLLLDENNTKSVISPLTRNPLDPAITVKEARDELLEIFEYIIERDPNADPITVAQSAIQGMIGSLDSHCSFLLPHEYKELFNTNKKSFGIGIEVTIRHHRLTVVSPIQDTPSYNSGIKAGDHIVRIDGKETKYMTLMEAVKRMRGKRGTLLVLTIMREEFAEPKNFSIERDVIPSQSVRFSPMEPGFGYLKITNFRIATFDDAQMAVNDLESLGTPLKGLILDLRDNPGGMPDQASKIADIFLKEGLIFSIKQRKKPHLRYMAHATGEEHDYPIIVLINKGSAGASEILAEALKDNERALVIGTTSFGKGSVQQISPLANGSALKYTVGHYATPSGYVFNEIGLMPQVLAGRPFDISKYILDQNVSDFENNLINKGATSEVAVIFTEELYVDDILDTTLRILKESGSNGLSAMLVRAEKIGDKRHISSLIPQFSNQTRGRASESSSQNSYLGDLSGGPSIEILNLQTTPVKVSPGSKFEVIVEYTVTDPIANQPDIPVSFFYTIHSNERILYEKGPIVVMSGNAKAMRRLQPIKASRKNGIYQIEIRLAYQEKILTRSIPLEIND